MAVPESAQADLDFRRLLEALPAAAYTCDAQGLITFYNQRAVQAWGREPKLNDPEDRYCGSFRMSSVEGQRVPHAECWMARCLKERRAFEGEEIVVERSDGTQLVVLAHAIPMFDADDTLLGAVNVVVDITDRKITEQKLQQSENALRAASQRKDEFLATLAHELRNPLAPIRNALRLLRQNRNGEKASIEPLQEMLERQINHLIRLVDDLMDVSRITQDRIELRRERVEFASIIHAAVESTKPMFDWAKHQLTVSVADEPLTVEGDPVRLTQVLANLLNNAAKYTESGGQISLDARRDGSHLVVSVKDSGVGIASEMLPQIFDLFTRADSSYGRRPGGLGIGLTLAKRLVAMHEGHIEARSDGAGRGSEFVVRLPLAPAAAATNDVRAPHPAPVVERRVLVVDDNRDAADSLAMVLASHGAEVAVAYDGISALDVLQSTRPSVVLLDIGMPGMDGYELARRVRQSDGKDLTIVALTGWGQEKDRRLSREAGIDHHLVKPVDLEQLLGVLAQR